MPSPTSSSSTAPNTSSHSLPLPPEPGGLPLLRARGIAKSFGTRVVLRGADIDLVPGVMMALMGENGSGKSTLIKCISGEIKPDAGSLSWLLLPTDHSEPSPQTATAWPGQVPRIGVVHQHFLLADSLTALENIVLSQRAQEKSSFWIPWKKHESHLHQIMVNSGLSVPLHVPVGTLSVTHKQRIEILKLLWQQAQFLIFDEPTALLPEQEITGFYEMVKALVSTKNCAALIVTHKMKEVISHCNRVAVLHRGHIGLTEDVAAVSEQDITQFIMGGNHEVLLPHDALREQQPESPHSFNQSSPRATLMTLKGFSQTTPWAPDHDTSPNESTAQANHQDLSIYAGDIVGVAGLEGSGQKELIEIIIGLRSVPKNVTLEFQNKNASGLSPYQRTKQGLRWLGPDRLVNSCFPELPLWENLFFGGIHCFPPFCYFNWKQRKNLAKTIHAQEVIAASGVQPTTPLPRLRDYSGGNQQKFLVGSLLNAPCVTPRLLVLPYPTRGVDAAGTQSIHAGIKHNAATQADGFLIFDSDLDELLAICHRIVVLFNGKIAGILDAKTENIKHRVGALMTGVTSTGEQR